VFLDFYDTHAHASYGSHEYDGDREAQMQEMASFIKASTLPSAPALAVGDFNCRPDSKAFQILAANGPVRRLMSIDTSIDHIFSVDKPGYVLDVVDTSPIQRRIQANGHATNLSDHNGYISIIRIRPA
jgi:endonuclease/exonuclease/phosphatase family metal-dependent hydrolase